MSPEFRPVAVVSCDISGHSSSTQDDQLANVAAINRIVAETLRACPDGEVVWCSGGDGGHTVFRSAEWQPAAMKLMKELVCWAANNGVLLRTTGHYGLVADVQGADGRVQLVGEALNYAGWLVNQLDVSGVVVSDRFKEGLALAGVKFHDPRLMPSKSLEIHLLHLMSFDGVESRWTEPAHEDHAKMAKALAEDHGWEVVFYAKRIWQVNPMDVEATKAVRSVRGELLRPAATGEAEKRTIGLFDDMRAGEVYEVVKLGQLVERPAGSVICKRGDGGDTMFVILRGRIGVYNSEGEGREDTAKPKHLLRYGEVAGELAYTMSRRRTADLVALSDVAMLSFSSAELRTRLDKVGAITRQRLLDFFSIRVLEHVSGSAPYLLDPLSSSTSDAAEALDVLSSRARLLHVDRKLHDVTLDVLDQDAVRKKGLYILVSGEVSFGQRQQVFLDGSMFPLLWVDVPEMLVAKTRTYRLESEECKILHIEADGLNSLDRQQRKALRSALRAGDGRHLDRFEFDVFISHTKRDLPIIEDICARFDEAGIRYWMDSDQIQVGEVIVNKIDEGLRRSRFLLACFSRNFLESAWGNEETSAVLHVDVMRANRALIPLVIDDVDAELAIPVLAQARRKLHWSKPDDVAELIARLKAGGWVKPDE